MKYSKTRCLPSSDADPLEGSVFGNDTANLSQRHIAELDQATGGCDKVIVRGHHTIRTDTSVLPKPIPCSIGFELRFTQ